MNVRDVTARWRLGCQISCGTTWRRLRSGKSWIYTRKKWKQTAVSTYKSSSWKGLKTPPVTCRSTVVESFTVWNNNNSAIMLEDAQESKHPHLSLPELVTSTNPGMGSPNTRWKRTHSRLNAELPECKWTTLAFRQTQKSRGGRWSLESAGLMSAGLEARFVVFFRLFLWTVSVLNR